MANIPLKSIKFPDLADTYTVPFNAGELPYNKSATYPSDTVGKALQEKPDADGTIANAEQLTSNIYEEDNTPYNFRTSGGSIDIGDRETDMLVGGTVAWNQLVNSGDTSVTVQSGHKYYSNINNTKTIGSSNGSAISINDSTKDNVIDLTQMFGSTIADYIYSLEQANSGAGVAWFKKLFPKPYYAYNAGELMSVNTSAHNTVGFNAWDEEWELGSFNDNTGQETTASDVIRCKNYIPTLPNTTYYAQIAGKAANIYFYDANKNYISFTGRSGNGTFTTPNNCAYIRFRMNAGYGTTYNNDICINLSWDGERDGEYEAYDKHSYPLDSSLTLRGIPKLDASNNLYYDGDTYESDGTVTRNTVYRAYASGDESLANAITDGTHTVVYSANNSTETADPYTNPQIVNDFGTEEYVDYAVSQGDRDVSIPVGHQTQYMANLKAKLEMSPNSPEGAGDYIVRQTNGENEYVTLASNATIQDIIARLEALENAES